MAFLDWVVIGIFTAALIGIVIALVIAAVSYLLSLFAGQIITMVFPQMLGKSRKQVKKSA